MDEEILQEEIETRLGIYGQIFDEYYATGTLPGGRECDVLADYIKTVLDDPGVRFQAELDVVWLASLRDSVLEFIRVLLPYYLQIEEQSRREREYMEAFFNGNLDMKRAMWGGMVVYIEENYEPNELNMEGYDMQLRNKEKDMEVIFDCLENEWKEALDEQERRMKEELVEKNKKSVERTMNRLYGTEEYKQRKKLEKYTYKYPELDEIARVIGREKSPDTTIKDDTVEKYKPLLLQHSPIRECIDGVTTGNNLSVMLPTEVALLADAKSEGMFYKKYATKQLQLLSGKSPVIAAKKKETDRKDKPRLTEGPIIVSLDTSGSMGGEKEKVSKALLIHLMEIAKKKKRKCLLITFSISAETLEVTHPKHWKKVALFLSEHFTGGTDGNQMLGYAIDALGEGAFEMADVLIVSDFEFDSPRDSIKKSIVKAQGQGTKFYGLRIGCGARYDSFYERSYEQLLDKMWVVNV